MNVMSIAVTTRVALFAGVILLFCVILYLIKKKKLSVKYALIWLFAAFTLFIFSVFPYIVLVLRDLLQMVMPVNVVFTIAFAFVFLLLLSLSSIVSGFSQKIKSLTQQISFLEKRIRELENKDNNNSQD